MYKGYDDINDNDEEDEKMLEKKKEKSCYEIMVIHP
jgi:hypothetical protein